MTKEEKAAAKVAKLAAEQAERERVGAGKQELKTLLTARNEAREKQLASAEQYKADRDTWRLEEDAFCVKALELFPDAGKAGITLPGLGEGCKIRKAAGKHTGERLYKYILIVPSERPAKETAVLEEIDLSDM